MPHPLSVFTLLASVWLTASPFAAARTLTSTDGRTIEVEVLGFDGLESVRFKRADTGQTFTVPITTFAEADQKALRTEAAAEADKPPVLRDGDLRLELSRLRFDSRKTSQDANLTDGSVVRDAIEITDEDWGYTITLRNSTNHELKDLRVDYMLFSEVEQVGGNAAALRREAGNSPFPVVAPGGRAAVRTSAITMQKVKLKGGITWQGTNKNSTRDTLHGVWLRVYRGDELILESATPSTLTQRERWAHPAP